MPRWPAQPGIAAHQTLELEEAAQDHRPVFGTVAALPLQTGDVSPLLIERALDALESPNHLRGRGNNDVRWRGRFARSPRTRSGAAASGTLTEAHLKLLENQTASYLVFSGVARRILPADQQHVAFGFPESPDLGVGGIEFVLQADDFLRLALRRSDRLGRRRAVCVAS